MPPKNSSSSFPVHSKWYVLTHHDMDKFKKWLDTENARRLDAGCYLLEPFFPYDFLRKADSHTTNSKATDNGVEKSVMTKSAIYKFFLHIVFLRGTEEDIDDIVNGKKNLGTFNFRLHYYKDVEGNHAIVPNEDMRDFFQNCIKYGGLFDLCPPVNEITSLDRVKILSGPFAGHKADVVRATHSKGNVHLELNVQIASGILTVKMKNVRSNQVVRLDTEFSGHIHDNFIERSQNKILSVYEHRVKRINDAATRLDDVRKLNEVFHYRMYNVKNKAAHAHFRALMLICAHLCHDRQTEEDLRSEVLDILSNINQNSPSKANTDTRTYLWIALYISTGNASYRDAAKSYMKERCPKSPKLRKFVSLMRKGKKV